MDPSDALQYLSASSLLVGGTLATIGLIWLAIEDPARTGTTRGRYAMNGLVMAGGAFLAFGLPSIHAAQAENAGWVGAAAILVLFLGVIVAYLVVHGIETINAGLPRNAVPITYVAVPCLFVGSIVTAVVSWQAGAVPTALPILLIASILAGGFTLVQGVSARANTLLGTSFTATLAVWGLSLVSDLAGS